MYQTSHHLFQAVANIKAEVSFLCYDRILLTSIPFAHMMTQLTSCMSDDESSTDESPITVLSKKPKRKKKARKKQKNLLVKV